jgi:hypothetical protein
VNAAPPDWFTSGSHKRYPTELYIVGVGVGASYEIAMTLAQNQVVQQIETNISSEIVNVVSSYSDNDRELLQSEFNAKGRSEAQARLKGLEAVEKASADDKFYVMMALEKSRYADDLKGELDQLMQSIRGGYDSAEKMLGAGQVFQALMSLLQTGDAAGQAQAKRALYRSFSGADYPADDIVTGPALLSETRLILGRVKLQPITGERQSGRSGLMLQQSFVVQANYTPEGASAQGMPGVPIVWKDERNKVVGKSATDGQGRAELWIEAGTVGNRRVTANIDLAIVPAVLHRDVRGLEAVFHYEVTAVGPFTFTVVVQSEDGKPAPEVEEQIARSLTDLGQFIAEDAPLRLTGKFRLVESHEVSGIGGTQYHAKSEMTLFLEESVGGEKLGSIVVTAQGVNRKSTDEAVKKSFHNLKLNQSELTQLVSQSGEKLKGISLSQSQKALDAARLKMDQGHYDEALKSLTLVVEGETVIAVRDSLIRVIQERIKEKSNIKQ